MNRFKKKAISIISAGLLGMMFIVLLQAATYNIHTWTGTGARRNTVEFQIQAPDTSGTNPAVFLPGSNNANSLGSSSLNFAYVYTNNIVNGSLTTAISTTATSGTSTGHLKTAYLKDGGAAVGTIAALEGSVLCSTTASSNAGNYVTVVVCPPTADYTSWIGVAAAAASTGSVVNIYGGGDWALALTSGSVVAGDVLVTSGTTQGYLWRDNTPTSGADVAVALGPGPVNAGGLTRVRLR